MKGFADYPVVLDDWPLDVLCFWDIVKKCMQNVDYLLVIKDQSITEQIKVKSVKCTIIHDTTQWRTGGGGRGGHGPRAQALEGAPGQLVGANFKKKTRPRQISKVTSLQCPWFT